ncbi:hypothetical protein K9L05_03340 [Candidatus Babeliales bacterium]|nr:hypothetical protein [Candidatus Babeliales bacterium]MCF7899654.1 hypothetical protein [Candidatus Babeliales bacterium]
MPDRLIDLFIKLAKENNGYISKNKRETHFKMLTDKEIERMEAVVQKIMDKKE